MLDNGASSAVCNSHRGRRERSLESCHRLVLSRTLFLAELVPLFADCNAAEVLDSVSKQTDFQRMVPGYLKKNVDKREEGSERVVSQLGKVMRAMKGVMEEDSRQKQRAREAGRRVTEAVYNAWGHDIGRTYEVIDMKLSDKSKLFRDGVRYCVKKSIDILDTEEGDTEEFAESHRLCTGGGAWPGTQSPGCVRGSSGTGKGARLSVARSLPANDSAQHT